MSIDIDFQSRYATTVLELEQLNKDLNKVLHEVQQYCCEVSAGDLLWCAWKAHSLLWNCPRERLRARCNI